MRMLLILVVCGILTATHADPTLDCGVSSGKAFCNLAGINLNDFVPASLDTKLRELIQVPPSVADLLPEEWDNGVLALAGVDKRYCKEFCFPSSRECTTILGERICTPQACATPCVNVPAYDTLNIAPNSLIEDAIDLLNDGSTDLVDKAMEGLRLLPEFTVSLFVTSSCDPELGMEVLAGGSSLFEMAVPVADLLDDETGASAGNLLQYDKDTRTITVTAQVPLAVGLVSAIVTLTGVVIGDTGASVSAVLVTLDTLGETASSTTVYRKDSPTVIGTMDPCFSHDSCTTCALSTDSCQWCDTSQLCSPRTSTCSCAGDCGFVMDSASGCSVTRDVCWVSAAAPDSSVVMSTSEYSVQLSRLEVMSAKEADTVSTAIDSNQDGTVSEAELIAYETTPALHPEIKRATTDDPKFDALGVFALVTGVLLLFASAVVVTLGLKRPQHLRLTCLRALGRSRPAKRLAGRTPATSPGFTSVA